MPAGPFVMGEGKEQYKHTLPYPDRIVPFLVTNAQYQVFMAAGGYTEPSYWTEARQAGLWKNGQFTDRTAPSALRRTF